MQPLCGPCEKEPVTEGVKDKGFVFDYWTLYLFSGHTSSSARPPRGLRQSNITGQHLRRRHRQWYLQVPIQAQEIPLGPHWQIVLVWPHERVGIAVIAYFPLIAFVTCGVCCCGARSKTFLSDVLNQTAELSPAPREGDAQEEACKESNKLCSGTKHQQSSSESRAQTEIRCRSIKVSDLVREDLTQWCCLRTVKGLSLHDYIKWSAYYFYRPKKVIRGLSIKIFLYFYCNRSTVLSASAKII